MSAFADFGPTETLPPEKVDLAVRLGFMDLPKWCAEHGFCYYLCWFPGYANELTCQVNMGGHCWGEYGEKLQGKRIKFSGKEGKVTGLAGKTFFAKDAVLEKDMDECEAGASEEERTAAELAKECGIASAWAIWRDGAVYEFGSKEKLETLPQPLIDTIGGSTGLAAVATSVLAAAKLKRLKKK